MNTSVQTESVLSQERCIGRFEIDSCGVVQAVLTTNSNLADLLALFFQNDIQAWSQRRQQRGGVWRHSQLKQLIDANIEQCLKRMTQVAPSKAEEVSTTCHTFFYRNFLRLA